MKSIFGDNRQAAILQFLCRKPSFAIGVLAERLAVSERTIRNDIKQLNEELDGCAIIEGVQGRYSLRIYNRECFQTILSRILEADDFLNSSRNRMDYTFGRLARSIEPLLTDELAYEMNIGRTTLVGDLKKLRAELEPYQIFIIGKTSKGLILKGSESDIRNYILENNYDALYKQYPLDPEIVETTEQALRFFEKNVQENFRKFLTVMLDRFLTGRYIGKLSPQFYNLTARAEFEIVNNLADKIAEFLRISFPMEEKLFLLLPIIGMRTPADVQNMESIELDGAMRPLMNKVFQQIRLEMDICLDDTTYSEEFLYHLMFMVNRLRFHIRLKNPMLEDLKSKYPLAWQMAGVAAKVIKRSCGLEVTEEEQGYLASYFGVFLEENELKSAKAYHVAVVCGAGRITARLVAAQLKKTLDSSAKITFFSDEKVTREELEPFDLVFATVDLPFQCDCPFIRIHEIFNEQELRHKIEKARYWDKVDVPIIDNNWFVMVGLLEESRFFVLDTPNDSNYDNAVGHMAQSLTDAGQVDENFLERLRARERRGTMVFDHSVAIPHSAQYVSDRLVLSIGVFPTPIEYQEHEIRVIFLIGLPEELSSDDSLLIRVYDEIIRIAQDSALLDKITQANNFQELLRVLYRQAGEN